MNYSTPNGQAVRSIRSILADLHRSIEWLSAETGIPLRTLKRRLLGESALTLDETVSIARVLGVRVESLIAAQAMKVAA
ncbi:hypothetical protein [Microbacterium hydrocarbonoxydans]|uniref:hypothetical protein n=1 Tax=Microbacterium hydrocarbonoxydans TaxID=273678 RepID=UPI003D99D88B